MSFKRPQWIRIFSRREYIALVAIILLSLISLTYSIKRNYVSPTDEASTPTTFIKLSTSDHYHDNSVVKFLPNNIVPDTTAAHYEDSFSVIGPTPILRGANNLHLGRMQFEVEYRLRP